MKFIRFELWEKSEMLEKWEDAYFRLGEGSAYVRAKDVNAVFDLGAPRFGNYIYEMNANQKKYILKTMNIVQTVLENN